MTTKPAKTDPWEKPNSDKFSFEEHARELARTEHEQFAQPDIPPAIGLREFLNRETRLQMARGGPGSTEVLIRGKAFLRVMPSGEFELKISRGRNTYDTFYSWDRAELERYVQSLSLEERK